MIRRLQLLDVLRFFLALWVAIYHLCGGHGWFQYMKYPYGNLIKGDKLGFFSSFVSLGYVAVPIFFVLSGYVIVLTSKNKSGSEFVAYRFSRLLPGFLFSFFLTLLFFRYGFKDIVSIKFDNLISTLNGSWETFRELPIVGSYWTLWVEAKFYLLFVLVLVLYKKIKYEKKVFTFIAFWLITEYFLVLEDSLVSKILISEYAMYFILGGLLALLTLTKEKFGILVLMCSCLVFTIYKIRLWIFEWSPTNPTLWRFGVLLFLGGVVVIMISSKLNFKKPKLIKNLAVLGQSSYLIYLLQESLGMPLTSYLVLNGFQIRFAILFSLILMVAVSLFFSAKIEPKIINIVRTKLLLSFKEM